MKQNQLVITIILVLAVGGLAFFGGMKYQASKQPSFGRLGQFNGTGMMRNENGQTQQGQNGNGSQAQNGNRQGMGIRGVTGEIIANDDKSITVKLPDGSSKIVLVGTTTTINKASSSSKSDLTTGTKVAVFGQTNTDGSVTAQNIQINPVTPTTPAAAK